MSLVRGLLFTAAISAFAQSSGELNWPKTIQSGSLQILFHEPQLDEWDRFLLKLRAAVAVQRQANDNPVYGIALLEAETAVEKVARQVQLDSLKVISVAFPSQPAERQQWEQVIRSGIQAKNRIISLDSLEEMVALLAESRKAANLLLNNTPPRIVFATTPSILVSIDGEPQYRPPAIMAGNASSIPGP